MNKAYKYIISVILLLISIIYMPFSYKLNANSGIELTGLEDWLIGYNIYPVQIIHDREYVTSINGSSSSISGNISNVNLIQYTSSGVTGVSSTRPNGNGGVFNGSMTLGLSSSTTTYNLHKGLYCFELVLNDDYVGYISLSLKQGSTYVIGSDSNDDYVINGNKLRINFVLQGEVTNTDPNFTLNINSYELIKSSYNSWNFPIESFPFIYQFMDNGIKMEDLINYNKYTYPIYRTYNDNKILFQVYIPNNVDVEIVFMITRYINDNNFLNYFRTDHDSDLVIKDYQLITSDFGTPNRNFRFCKMTLGNSSQSTTFRFYAKESFLFIPIYLSRKDFTNVSTDFALTFGLSNALLDNLDIITNGNNTSNSSVNNADSTNQQASTTFQQEEQLVSNAENDLSTKLNNLDIQNQNNSLFGNSKFIASASWVKTQFDYFTNNNAFGYLITFSLVIGIALVIIGKLRG